MSAALQLELQALQSCVDEDDADRAREVVGNIAQLCLNDVTERNIGCNTQKFIIVTSRVLAVVSVCMADTSQS